MDFGGLRLSEDERGVTAFLQSAFPGGQSADGCFGGVDDCERAAMAELRWVAEVESLDADARIEPPRIDVEVALDGDFATGCGGSETRDWSAQRIPIGEGEKEKERRDEDAKHAAGPSADARPRCGPGLLPYVLSAGVRTRGLSCAPSAECL